MEQANQMSYEMCSSVRFRVGIMMDDTPSIADPDATIDDIITTSSTACSNTTLAPWSNFVG